MSRSSKCENFVPKILKSGARSWSSRQASRDDPGPGIAEPLSQEVIKLYHGLGGACACAKSDRNFTKFPRARTRTPTGFSSHDNTLSWGKSRRFWGAKLLPTRGENTFSPRLFRAEKPPLKWGGKWMVFVIIFDRRDDKLYKYLRLFRLTKLLDNLSALRYD